MKKWNLPLTYKPKIARVLDGSIRQTIRLGRKFKIGNLVAFHGWEGKPRRSKWSFRTPYFEITEVFDIIITHSRFAYLSSGYQIYWQNGYNSFMADQLAQLDGIDPPTGAELIRLFEKMYKIPITGMEAQIIRW